MAHFAEIDEAGTVLRVIVVPDENEADGAQWCADLLGGTWLQTSFNTHAGEHREGGTPLRKNFAGKGYTYDARRDAFIPPRPFDSWALDEATAQWQPPTPKPDGPHAWDEAAGEWIELEALADG